MGALRVDHLIARGHRQLAFAYTGIAKWRALGDYWLDGITTAARAHALPPVAVDAVTVENAVEVITRWHRAGVTAVCAQSDEVAALVLYGIREAGLTCPDDMAVIGVDAHPIGTISSPPLDHGRVRPRRCGVGGGGPRCSPTSATRHRRRRNSPNIARLVIRSST